MPLVDQADAEKFFRKRVNIFFASFFPDTERHYDNNHLFFLHAVDNAVTLPDDAQTPVSDEFVG